MAPCRDYTLELAPSALFRNVKVKNILDLNSDRFQYRSLFVPRPVHIKKLKFYFKKIIHNVLFNPAHRSTNNQIEAKIVRGSDYLVRGGDYYRVKVGLQKNMENTSKTACLAYRVICVYNVRPSLSVLQYYHPVLQASSMAHPTRGTRGQGYFYTP